MEVSAKLNYLRISPRKVRLVADLIRQKRVTEARRILDFTTKRPAKPLLKLLNSAISNAKHNFQLDPKNLWISKLLVEEGPKLKRWRPRARGQADEIQKRTSHITIILSEIKGKQRKEVSKKKKAPKVVKEFKAEIKEKEPVKERAKPLAKKEVKEIIKPKIQKGIKRIFRRKAF